MRFITPRGMAGLGWGLPMALVPPSPPNRSPIYCITGDGGFAHVWSEMEVAARSNLKVTLIVLNNGILGCVVFQLRYGKNSTSVDIFPSIMWRSPGLRASGHPRRTCRRTVARP